MKNFIVPYFGWDGNYIHEFKDIDITSLTAFTLENTLKIVKEQKCYLDRIILCIPQYMIEFLKYEHSNKTSEHGSRVTIDENMTFCGIKVQVAFENKATIFFNSVIPDKIIKYTKEL